MYFSILAKSPKCSIHYIEVFAGFLTLCIYPSRRMLNIGGRTHCISNYMLEYQFLISSLRFLNHFWFFWKENIYTSIQLELNSSYIHGLESRHKVLVPSNIVAFRTTYAGAGTFKCFKSVRFLNISYHIFQLESSNLHE